MNYVRNSVNELAYLAESRDMEYAKHVQLNALMEKVRQCLRRKKSHTNRVNGGLIGGKPASEWAKKREAQIRALCRSVMSDSLFAERDTKKARLDRCALGLANHAGMHFDEHGDTRGDYRETFALDYVGPKESKKAPYFDMGNAGLALIRIERKRVYAKSSQWWPKTASNIYLVGRNEAGTWFSHAVSKSCGTVLEALDWIWHGKADRIVRRQGDIAVITGRGKDMPLPAGHRVQGDLVTHATHPAIPVPSKGERLIVGRRADTRVMEESRD